MMFEEFNQDRWGYDLLILLFQKKSLCVFMVRVTKSQYLNSNYLIVSFNEILKFNAK